MERCSKGLSLKGRLTLSDIMIAYQKVEVHPLQNGRYTVKSTPSGERKSDGIQMPGGREKPVEQGMPCRGGRLVMEGR